MHEGLEKIYANSITYLYNFVIEKKMKYIHYCHGSRLPVKESIGNIVSRKLHPNSFSRMVFENYSMMFCKTKARLKI